MCSGRERMCDVWEVEEEMETCRGAGGGWFIIFLQVSYVSYVNINVHILAYNAEFRFVNNSREWGREKEEIGKND
jgi:hypothetical protein